MKSTLSRIAGLAAGLVLSLAASTGFAASVEVRQPDLDALARQNGTVKVMVLLKAEAALANVGRRTTAAAQQKSRIADARQRVFTRLPQLAGRASTRTFEELPYLALEVDSTELAALRNDAAVLAVIEDRVFKPLLADSVPLIGAQYAAANNARGSGQAVVIIDSGVDKNHPFLAGRTIAEACFSAANENAATKTVTSYCPGGVASVTGNNTALPCPPSFPECYHGTHVAGIAAGQGGGSSNVSYSGVAPSANIIPMQVFHGETLKNCSENCVKSVASQSSIVAALNEVLRLQANNVTIAAVNMSLGGASHVNNSNSCDYVYDSQGYLVLDQFGQPVVDPIKVAIDELKRRRIATVVATGNLYEGEAKENATTGISYPSCISSAIAVSATTKTDTFPDYAYTGPLTKLLAPGGGDNDGFITSSLPTSGYIANYYGLSGTSMAAPHVAGAIALLKLRRAGLEVDQIIDALVKTGVTKVDTRNGTNLAKPRIRADLAANFLVRTVLVSKNSTNGNDAAHTISWGNANDATGLAGFNITIDGTTTVLGAVTSYTTNLSPVQVHNISVAARLPGGVLSTYPSTATYSYADTGAPTTPTGLTATKVNSTTVRLGWTAATDNVGVAGYRTSVDGGAWSATTTATSVNLTVSANVAHTLRVVAVDAAGNTSAAASIAYAYNDNIAPTTPTGLAAVRANPTVSSTSTRITWNAATDDVGVAGYRLTIDGVATNVGNTTAYTTTLTAGVTHSLSVAALDAAGNVSVASAAISYLSTDNIKPSAPTGLAAARVSPTTSSVSTRISWTAATDDVAVKNYRLSIDGVVTTLGNVTSTTVNLTAGVNHVLFVSAVDAAGNASAASASVNYLSTDNIRPALVTGLSVTKLTTNSADFLHRISWQATTDDVAVTKYKLLIYAGSIPQAIVFDAGTTLSYTLPLMPNTDYSYAISAYDAAGNYSTTTYARFNYAGSCQSNYGGTGGTGSPSVTMSIYSIPRTVSATGTFFTAPGVLPNNFLARVSIVGAGPTGSGEIAFSCGTSATATRSNLPTQGGESGDAVYTGYACDYYGVCAQAQINNTAQ